MGIRTMNNSTIPLPTAAQQAAATGSSNMTLIIVAVAIGLIAAGINFWYIGRVEQQISLTSKTCYRLANPMSPGQKLRVDKDLVEAPMPAQYADSLVDLVKDNRGETSERKVMEGQVFARAAKQGEMLSRNMFTSDTVTLDAKVAKGMRACPLPINSRNPAGILRAGMYVDLVGDFTLAGTKNPRSLTVIEHVKVLAVGTNMDETGKTARTGTNITVEVNPEVGNRLLTIAKFIGRDGFDVLIRNSDDLTYKGEVSHEVLKIVGLEE